MASLTSLERIPSRQGIVSQLEDAISEGRLAPGDRLPSERHLAESFGVSRPVIREALRTLAGRGYIEIAPGRGAFVLRPSAVQGADPLERQYLRRGATVRDLSEARLMLENEAAGLAAERASADDIADLEAALCALEGAVSALERIRRDLGFHLRIATATHNPVIETMFVSIMRLSVELMIRSAADAKVRRRSAPYHRAVYEAIKAHDRPSASQAITAHLAVASQMYGPDYEEQLDLVALRGMHSLGYSDVEDLLRDLAAHGIP